MADHTRSEKDRNPILLLPKLFAQVEAKGADYPNAMALSTCSPEGAPSTRMVLIKGVDDEGLVFYTNLGSRKAREIRDNSRVCLHAYWREIKRQVLVEGTVEKVSDEQADAYFASRPRNSRIGAWASRQSEPMKGRGELLKRVAAYETRFFGGPVPRPEFWSGFRVIPDRFELWEEGAFRLHKRSRYERTVDGWRKTHLFP